MGIFKRLFSADYRAAIAAEAAGDLDLAAERYALAGQLESAVRVHLARAERARSRVEEIDALRDALHWAPPDGEWRQKASIRLGNALLAQIRAEGVATDRDRERVKNAAALLEEAGDFGNAGQAFESIGDDVSAARAFAKGGLVERMETALERQEEFSENARAVRQAALDYEVALFGGERFRARDQLLRCVELAEHKNEYRQLLDELESKLIASGRVVMEVRKKLHLTVASVTPVRIGRDPRCELVLRSQGISREHAQITMTTTADQASFELHDLGSRNGTLMGGLPLSGALPLVGTGTFQVGTDCQIGYAIEGTSLELAIDSGLDRDTRLLIVPVKQAMHLGRYGIEASLSFRDGRPVLSTAKPNFVLGGKRLSRASVELIRGDVLSIAGIEIEVRE